MYVSVCISANDKNLQQKSFLKKVPLVIIVAQVSIWICAFSRAPPGGAVELQNGHADPDAGGNCEPCLFVFAVHKTNIIK